MLPSRNPHPDRPHCPEPAASERGSQKTLVLLQPCPGDALTPWTLEAQPRAFRLSGSWPRTAAQVVPALLLAEDRDGQARRTVPCQRTVSTKKRPVALRPARTPGHSAGGLAPDAEDRQRQEVNNPPAVVNMPWRRQNSVTSRD